MSRTALFKAAAAWDADGIERLLSDQPTLVAARDATGRAALHVCARRRWDGKPQSAAASIATARALLAAGTDINVVHDIRDEGETFPATPLWYAVAWGRNPPLVTALLSCGASPDYCLWAVVWARDGTLARQLLKAGSRTELKFAGETPLLYAARLGRVEVIGELVAAGADVQATDKKGMTALDYARKKRLGDDVLGLLTATSSAKRTRNARRGARAR